MAVNELDVRQLRKPDKHPTIFATYAALSVGESFVLVNNHDPKHLRAEFDADYPGSYDWEYLDKGPDVWQIRIGKLTATPLPRTEHQRRHSLVLEPRETLKSSGRQAI